MELKININIGGGFKIDLPAEVLLALRSFTRDEEVLIRKPEPAASPEPEKPAVSRVEIPQPALEEPSDLPFNEQGETNDSNHAPEPPKKEKQRYTAEYIRAEFNKVRDKLEYGECAPGESKGPNDKPDPKIHKLLTARFMEMSQELGGVKPTELVKHEDAESLVPEFIRRINELIVVDGEIQIKVPF